MKQHMSNVDEVISLLKQKAKRIEDQRDALQAKCERYEKALRELVRLKDLKDKDGKTDEYLQAQPLAWKAANEALTGGWEREVDNG